MESLLKKIKNIIYSRRMITPGDKVLIALSGGSDSVALLSILKVLSKDLRINLSVAHFNHLARGEESHRDAKFVEDLCRQWQIPAFFSEKNIKNEQKILKQSFQETARTLRYQFFKETLELIQGDKVALGHTADDQAETTLMNLTRGSGLKGISGIPPVRQEIIRPLIDIRRQELIDYLESMSIKFCTDSTNNSTVYLRNRVRLDFIPYLEKNYNSKIVTRLSEMSHLIRDDEELLSELTREWFEKLSFNKKLKNSISFPLELVQILNIGLQKRIWLSAIEFIKGDLRSIESSHIKKMIEASQKNSVGKLFQIPGFIEVVFSSSSFTVRTKKIKENLPSFSGFSKLVSVPGETLLEELGVSLNSRIIQRENLDIKNKRQNEEFFDFEVTRGKIQCRLFNFGDRFTPLGMTGSKKVKSFFIDKKIPKNERNRIPILTNAKNDIIWIYGHRICHDFRVTEQTQKVLAIKGIKL